MADQIVGLSNGEVVLAGETGALSRERVVEAIVGAAQEGARERAHEGGSLRTRQQIQRSAQVPRAETVFEARGIGGNGLAGVSLHVAPGETLGVYGLVGSGRSRFMRAVYGLESMPEGQMFLKGRPFQPIRPDDAIAQGVAYLSEERKHDGFIPQMTSIENIVLPVLGRYRSGALLRWRSLRRAAAEVLSGIPIRGEVDLPITSLSGGNQQKALFARAVLQSPDLLLLDEPTKGVDIGAKSEIYEIIRGLSAAGRSVIVVSSEEEELLEIADRIVVFRNGACDGEPVPEDKLSVASLRRRAWAQT